MNALFRLLPVAMLLGCLVQPADLPADDRDPVATAVLLTTDFVLAPKHEALGDAAAASGIELHVYQAGVDTAASVQNAVDKADLLIVDAPRGNDFARIQEEFGALLGRHQGTRYTYLAGDKQGQGLSEEQLNTLHDYYANGRMVNFVGFFQFWGLHVAGLDVEEPETPVLLPETGIYHPGMREVAVAEPDDYLQWLKDERDTSPGEATAVVGILVPRGDIVAEQTTVVDTLVRTLEQQDAIPWVFFFDGQDPRGMRKLLGGSDGSHVDVAVNMTHIFGLEDRPAELAELDIPMVQTVVARDHDVAGWASASDGFPMRLVPSFVAMPEQMGLQDPLVIGAVEHGHPVVLPEQLDALTGRLLQQARLARTPAAERRLGLMVWSYPPGEVGVSASHMNVPRSLEHLTERLGQHGYAIDTLASSQAESVLPDLIRIWQTPDALESWTVDHEHWQRLPVDTYRSWLKTLPETIRQRIHDAHGDPLKDPMVIDHDDEAVFVIPAMTNGKLVIVPQPPRGDDFHRGERPPSHAYLAAYLWLREGFDANALIHFGTHGSQEFLPGKERGLWAFDDALLPLGDLPVFYPYIVDNIGEALQARRRGRAVTITHQTPPFAPSGLHGQLYDLHELIHDWEELAEGPVRRQVETDIIEKLVEQSLHEDLGWSREDMAGDFETFEAELHDYLHDVAQDTQPLGLHVFGRSHEPAHRASTIMQMLGERLYEALNMDLDELFVEDHQNLHELAPMRFVLDALNGNAVANQNDTLRELAEEARVLDQELQAESEITALLRALDGGFVRPSPGGDPIRNPTSLPTGRNLFGFDPARLPTRQAWQVGKTLADDFVADYFEAHGKWPSSIALSLWSSEALRHQGVMEAKLLRLMGLQPEWDDGGRLQQVRVTPEDDLGRPRVDVVASVTGVYRDQFPHFIQHFSEGVLALSDLPENGANPIGESVRQLSIRLVDQGIDPDRARQLAAIRMFSGPSGQYGTGVPDDVLGEESWEREPDIAEAYLTRMQYGYGADERVWGVTLDDINLYREQLTGVEAAVLGRSSNLNGLLSTDHPFEYLGGIGMAVRHLSGRSPELHVANMRDPGNERMQRAEQFLAGELRSRYHHPGWIEAMMAEGYAGTLELQNIVNNAWGWQVTAPEMIGDHQWEAFHATYVEDALDLGLAEWFAELNPEALTRIVERLIDAVRSEHWDADDGTVEALIAQYDALRDEHGDTARSSTERDTFVAEAATGFGLDLSAVSGAGAPAMETVAGERMQPVDSEPAAPAPDPRTWLIGLGLLILILVGGSRQHRLARRHPMPCQETA